MTELQEVEVQSIRILRYLRRLSMEVEECATKLRTGELVVKERHIGTDRTPLPGGPAPPPNGTSTLSQVRDTKMDRCLVATGKQLTGRKPQHPDELTVVDVENLKVRVFSAEFPDDPAVKEYHRKPTMDNRLALLIHIMAAENGVRPGDLMDLYGMSADWLMTKLKEYCEDGDKRVREKYLNLAFKLKFPEKKSVNVQRPVQNNYFGFSDKQEVMEALLKQEKEVGPKVPNSKGEYEEAEVL